MEAAPGLIGTASEGALTPLCGSPSLTEVSITRNDEFGNDRRESLAELRNKLPREILTADSNEAATRPRMAEGVVVTGAAHSVGESTHSSPGGASLFWLEGPDGVRHHLEAVATIGRAEGNDIRLGSPTVSRFHAMLRTIGGHWVLVDLDSRNGTRVRDERITAPRVLRPNDPIQFGEMPFIFRSSLDQVAPRPTGIHFAVQSHATEHFRLLFQPDTFAEQQVEIAGARLERVYAVLTEIFGAEDGQGAISVYLLDQVADRENPDQLVESGGYARPERRLIYAAYRPESPGVTLEHDLLEIVGSRDPGLSRWPRSLRDGFLLFVTRRAEPLQATDEQWTLLLSAFEEGTIPPLAKIISHSEPDNVQVDTLAVAHFIEFLAATYQTKAVAVFLSQLSQTSLDAASRAAFHRPIKSVEKSWHKRMKSATLGGVRLFVSLLFPYLRPYKLKIAEIIVYVALSVAFGIVLAKAEGYLVDKALLAGSFKVFWRIMAGLLLAFFITSLASLRENYVKAWVSAHLLSRIRLSMFQKVQALDTGYFDRTESGDLLTRLTSDVFMVENALTSGMVETIRFSLMFVVALVVIFFTQWELAIVTVVGIPLFVVVGRLLGRPVTKASMELQVETSAVTGTIHQNLGAQPVVKLFGLEQRESETFSGKLDRLIRSSLRLHFLGGLYGFGSNAITSLIQLAVLGFGGYLVLEGKCVDRHPLRLHDAGRSDRVTDADAVAVLPDGADRFRLDETHQRAAQCAARYRGSAGGAAAGSAGARDPDGARRLQLRRHATHPGRRQSDHSSWRQRGGRRAERLRKEHRAASPDPLLRSGVRAGALRWRRPQRRHRCIVARPDRDGFPGELPLQRVGAREHPHGPAGGERCRGRASSA